MKDKTGYILFFITFTALLIFRNMNILILILAGAFLGIVAKKATDIKIVKGKIDLARRYKKGLYWKDFFLFSKLAVYVLTVDT